MDNETKQILKVIARALVAIAEVSVHRLDVETEADSDEALEQAGHTDDAIGNMRNEKEKL